METDDDTEKKYRGRHKEMRLDWGEAKTLAKDRGAWRLYVVVLSEHRTADT